MPLPPKHHPSSQPSQPHHSDPYERPISPPLPSLPHHKAVKEGKGRTLVLSIIFGTLISAMVGFILFILNISINVILPVLAPIWVGSITLIYSVNYKH